MDFDLPILPVGQSSFSGIGIRLWFFRIMRSVAVWTGNNATDSIPLDLEFRQLIRRHNSTISQICFSYACSVADYDDLRQDALINIWRGMKKFRHESSRLTWIYRVTVNSCLSTIRKQSRHQHESLEELYGLIAEDDGEKESIETLHTIISGLGLQERAIIMMWLDEMSYEEISDVMGLNRNTIATKIRRIKEKITKQYKEEIYDTRQQ